MNEIILDCAVLKRIAITDIWMLSYVIKTGLHLLNTFLICLLHIFAEIGIQLPTKIFNFSRTLIIIVELMWTNDGEWFQYRINNFRLIKINWLKIIPNELFWF